MTPRELAARGSRAVLDAASRAQFQPLTDAERASYADTRVCAELGFTPSHWERDPEDGRWVLSLTRAVPEAKSP